MNAQAARVPSGEFVAPQFIAEVEFINKRGEFISMMRPRVVHLVEAKHPDSMLTMANLIHHCVRIDDKQYTAAQIGLFEYPYFAEIAEKLGDQMQIDKLK